jgi:DNA-binding CsgD family transcriptional regulator
LFRHELARQVILEGIPPGRRMQLAAAALAELTQRPASAPDSARLAALAEEARDEEAALRHAVRAAGHAATVGAHREAASQYRRALRHAGLFAPAERASLLERLAYETYLTAQVTEGIAARREALDIWRGLGDRMKQGENMRWLSRLLWYNGEGEAAEHAATAALDELEGLGSSAQLAWAYSNLSQLRMLAYRNQESLELGQRAIAVGKEAGDEVVVVHALNNIGNARIRMDVDQGWADLEASLRLALDGGQEEHAARAYVNLYWNQIDRLQLDAAEATFREGCDYCDEHDLDAWYLYLRGGRCQHLLLRGDWSAASTLSQEIRGIRARSPVTGITPLAVLGVVRARRGDPDPAPVLDEAFQLAAATGELQRLGPALVALGEAAWLRGETDLAAADFQKVRALAADRDEWWRSMAEAWLARIGRPAAVTIERAVGPYRRELAGQHAAAAIEWASLGCPYEEALALARTDAAGHRRALTLLDGLGARATMAVVSRALRASGARSLPRGPRATTRANPFGLTAREVQVGDLLRRGLRNADIAVQLHLSPKTVEHHVASILSKLGATTRTAAAASLSEHLVTET